MTIDCSVTCGSWCGDQPVKLSFPDSWDITNHTGNISPPLHRSEVTSSLDEQLFQLTPSLFSQSAAKVAIVIDDHTRPTPSADILAPLLRFLLQRNFSPDNIKILVAIGTHIIDDPSFMDRKLGGIHQFGVEVVFPDCKNAKQLKYIGTSDTNIPVYVNHHYADADIKITISGIYPHDEAGFSGGAKILIGILGHDTLSKFHRRHGLLTRGSAIDTKFRLELEHIADIAGIDLSINCLINDHKNITGMYGGNFRQSFRQAVHQAQADYATTIDPDADIVISNAYPLDTSLSVIGKSRWPFNHYGADVHKIIVTGLCNCSGDRLPLATSPKELYLQKIKRRSGATALKKLLRETLLLRRYKRNPRLKWKDNYVVHIPYIEPGIVKKPAILNTSKVEYNWQAIINELSEHYENKQSVNVSVYPCSPLLYPVIQ